MAKAHNVSFYVVIFLLTLHAGLAFHCACADFAIYDEFGHIASGLFSLRTGSYHFYNVNPPITKQLAVMPVSWLDLDTHSLVKSDIPGERREIPIASEFARDNASILPTLLVCARLPGIAWSVLGGWLVYCWSGRLFGTRGGLLSLSLWCFEPNIIAHAHLVTADVPSAVAAAAASLIFACYLQTPSWCRALFAGLLLGLAESTKFTLLILYPVWAILWLLSLLGSSRRHRFGTSAVQIVVVYAVSLFVINLSYEFSGSFKVLGDYRFVSQTLVGRNTEPHSSGNRFAGTILSNIPVPLPEHYLRGLDQQRRGLEQSNRVNYLGGEWKRGGWWYYYLYGLGVKVPIGTSLLLVLAVGLSLSYWIRRGNLLEFQCLTLPPLAVLCLLSSQSNLNGHTRYALVAFPFAIILIGQIGAWAATGRWWRKAVIGCLLAWSVLSCLAVHPCELAYFNELAGGPQGGPNHLLGSNVDWGQDLWRLQVWLRQHPEARPLYVAYHGGVDPSVIGITCDSPFSRRDEERPETWSHEPFPGWYAVSVNYIHSRPDISLQVRDGGPVFGNLEYFQCFHPVGQAGYSILVFNITLKEANSVRRQMGLPVLDDSVLLLNDDEQRP